MKYDGLLLVAVFCGLSPALFAQEASRPDVQSGIESKHPARLLYDPTRDAAADIRKATTEARKTGKRILVDVGGDWCPWCHSLDQLFREHPDLLELRDRNFIMVPVFYDSENKNEGALSRYSKVLGIPHFFILDDGGTLLYSQHVVELQTDGKYSADKMRAFLTKWSPAALNDSGSSAVKKSE